MHVLGDVVKRARTFFSGSGHDDASLSGATAHSHPHSADGTHANVVSFETFLGERCTVHVDAVKRALRSWSCTRFFFNNMDVILRECAALTAHRQRIERAANHRSSSQAIFVQFDFNQRNYVYRVDGGFAVADHYLLYYPRTSCSVYIYLLRRHGDDPRV